MNSDRSVSANNLDQACEWARKQSFDPEDRKFPRLVGIGKTEEDRVLVPQDTLLLASDFYLIFQFDAEAKIVRFMGYLSAETRLKTPLVTTNLVVWKNKLGTSLSSNSSNGIQETKQQQPQAVPSLKGLFLEAPTTDVSLKDIERALRIRAAALKGQPCPDDFMWLQTPAAIQANAASFAIAKMAAAETERLRPGRRLYRELDFKWVIQLNKWKAAETQLMNKRLEPISKDEKKQSRLLTELMRPRVITSQGRYLDFTLDPPTMTPVDFRDEKGPWFDLDLELQAVLDPEKECTRWVEFPFEKVQLDHIRRRKVIIRRGVAYVPMYQAIATVWKAKLDVKQGSERFADKRMQALVKLWRVLYHGIESMQSLVLGKQVQSFEELPMPKCMERLMKQRAGQPPEYKEREFLFRYLAILGQNVPALVRRKWPKADRDVISLANWSYKKVAPGSFLASCKKLMEEKRCPHLETQGPGAALFACHGALKGTTPVQYTINRAKAEPRVVIKIETPSQPQPMETADEKPTKEHKEQQSHVPMELEEFVQLSLGKKTYAPACPPDAKAATEQEYTEAATRVLDEVLTLDPNTSTRDAKNAVLRDLGARGLGVRVSDWQSKFESVFNSVAEAWTVAHRE